MGLIGFFNFTRPRVMIIQSYDAEFPWSQGLEKSFRTQLKNFGRPILTRYHYMDLRGAPTRLAKQTAAASAIRSVEQFKPQVLVVFDDIAAELVTPRFLDRPGMSIVFAGIGESLSHHGFDTANNVTGMQESLPMQALYDAVNAMADGKPLTIGCIRDAQPNSAIDAKEFAAVDWHPHNLLPCEEVDNFPAWKDAVMRIGGKADILFVAGYRGLHSLADGDEVVPSAEVGIWTEANSQALTIGSKVTFVGDGFALSITSSPLEQGQTAALLTQKILSGAKASDIPPTIGRDFFVSISPDRIAKHGRRLPPVYEAASRAAGTLQ